MSVENAELLESIFGRWPSFHDAEIHTIFITRDCDSGPQMDVAIHLWEMTNEVDAKGFFVLKHHTLTTLRFCGVSELQLADFNNQNVLFDLELTEETGKGFVVSMPTSYGCYASFKCQAIRVISAEACDPKGKKRA
jgi:hypothetical protein